MKFSDLTPVTRGAPTSPPQTLPPRRVPRLVTPLKILGYANENTYSMMPCGRRAIVIIYRSILLM